MEQTTRNEHLEWCKVRAREYLDAGDAPQAFASFASDMSKHPETAGHIGLGLGLMMLMSRPQTVDEARRWVEGFN